MTNSSTSPKTLRTILHRIFDILNLDVIKQARMYTELQVIVALKVFETLLDQLPSAKQAAAQAHIEKVTQGKDAALQTQAVFDYAATLWDPSTIKRASLAAAAEIIPAYIATVSLAATPSQLQKIQALTQSSAPEAEV